MIGHRSLSLIVTLSLLAAVPILLAQAGGEAKRPNFAGTWVPTDSALSEQFWGAGLGWIPGDGRVVIEQTSTRLTVTKHIPDAKLDRYLSFQRQFNPVIIYWIEDSVGPVGRGSPWRGDRLVLTEGAADNRRYTVSILMDGDRLKMEVHTVIASDHKEGTTSEWFQRANLHKRG